MQLEWLPVAFLVRRGLISVSCMRLTWQPHWKASTQQVYLNWHNEPVAVSQSGFNVVPAYLLREGRYAIWALKVTANCVHGLFCKKSASFLFVTTLHVSWLSIKILFRATYVSYLSKWDVVNWLSGVETFGMLCSTVTCSPPNYCCMSVLMITWTTFKEITVFVSLIFFCKRSSFFVQFICFESCLDYKIMSPAVLTGMYAVLNYTYTH